ncbi:MAG: hypothetical protein JO182_25935 [Acidobacteriaceae bacterium]|nr:hypothetical protein [Acidobacteriaceae bacterium]MBV9037956.1 hypothetical protein [Acidobacteriaceae bacterium]MBV9227655.1 hypothetical protein [Acidobacteriaceae bacterium]MBV9306977.1 hypothetical protein [Acidobacteriaceae bacterium]MBV9675081.1 hypothetical protein [Acidobacteriaceae bacterium]
MTITLTPAQERAIQQAIQRGVFRSVDDFIEAALRTLDRPAPAVTAAPVSSDQQEENRPGLVRKGRFLIHPGIPRENFDVLKAIEEIREEHARRLLGL